LDVILQLLDLLLTHGVNRKRITLEKGLLNQFTQILKEILSNQHIVIQMLEIIHKIACGATRSKRELRAANVLPVFTEVITTYTSMPEVRNLANNCISDIFKPGQFEEEDSNESLSSDTGSDEDESGNVTPHNEKEDNCGDVDVDSNNAEFSLQSLKQALESEKSASQLVDKYSDTLKMQEDLGNERFARKKLEEEVIQLKHQLHNS